MNIIQRVLSTGSLAGVLRYMTIPAAAQDLYVYPSRGQTDQQLADDRYACHRWAVQESGFDPSQFNEIAPPRTVKVPVPENEAEGAAAKGAIAGAAAGGIIGAHDGNAGKGAVIGAVVGTIAGAAIEEQGANKAREAAEEEARRQAEDLAQTKAEKALRRSNYRRALMACLEGRGYTVK